MTNTFFNLFVIYQLVYFTSFVFLGMHSYTPTYLVLVYLQICFLLTLFKVLFYWAKKLYRTKGFNSTRVVVIGKDKNLQKLRRIFDHPEYGYQYMGYFDNVKSSSPSYLGKMILE